MVELRKKFVVVWLLLNSLKLASFLSIPDHLSTIKNSAYLAQYQWVTWVHRGFEGLNPEDSPTCFHACEEDVAPMEAEGTRWVESSDLGLSGKMGNRIRAGKLG